VWRADATKLPNLPTPLSTSSAPSPSSSDELEELDELEAADEETEGEDFASSEDAAASSVDAEGDPHFCSSDEEEDVGEGGMDAFRTARNALVEKLEITAFPVVIWMVRDVAVRAKTS
jgi:hypothetical protein